MTDKPAKAKPEKLTREERLAQNLRANLRRRKQATRKTGDKGTSSGQDS